MRNRSLEYMENRFGETLPDHVEGCPGNPDARHTCCKCGAKRFERDMKTTGNVRGNNYKDWVEWQCVDCKPRRKHKF